RSPRARPAPSPVSPIRRRRSSRSPGRSAAATKPGESGPVVPTRRYPPGQQWLISVQIRLHDRKRRIRNRLITSGGVLVADVDLEGVVARDGRCPGESAAGRVVARDAPGSAGQPDPEAISRGSGTGRVAAERDRGAMRLRAGRTGGGRHPAAAVDGEGEVEHAVVSGGLR